jgi:hypothetical protein
MRFRSPRLRAPVRAAVLCTVLAAIVGAAQGRVVAVVLEAGGLVIAAGCYVRGGTDTGVGAVTGGGQPRVAVSGPEEGRE